MSSNQIDMWNYWRDKYGYITSIEEYFAATLANNSELQQAVAQIKNAERAINKIMEELLDD